MCKCDTCQDRLICDDIRRGFCKENKFCYFSTSYEKVSLMKKHEVEVSLINGKTFRIYAHGHFQDEIRRKILGGDVTQKILLNIDLNDEVNFAYFNDCVVSIRCKEIKE